MNDRVKLLYRSILKYSSYFVASAHSRMPLDPELTLPATNCSLNTMKPLRSKYFRFLISLAVCVLPAGSMMSCASPSLVLSGPDSGAYREYLEKGRRYLDLRKYVQALELFENAEHIKPGQAEAISGRAQALFRLGRYAQTLEACGQLTGDSPGYFNALGFCWGARLEIGRAAGPVVKQVQQEIDRLLEKPAPSMELQYAAYLGYSYLKKREKRLPLLLQLAGRGNDSSLADSIAAALFEEIIKAERGSAEELELAESYIDNFPEKRMAYNAALIVLKGLAAKEPDRTDSRWLTREVLGTRETHYQLNGAVAFWLIEHHIDYDRALALLDRTLQLLQDAPSRKTEDGNTTISQDERAGQYLYYHYLQGRAWLAKGDSAKALEILEAAAGPPTVDPEPFHFLGLAALAEGRSEQAMTAFYHSLVRGGRRPETIAEVKILLAENDDYLGEPREYFRDLYPGPVFQDTTEKAGLAGVKAERAAWGDYDNDGDDDLLLDGSRLFPNQGNGVFGPVELLPGGGLGITGAVWGDYDNDGFVDIFVTARRKNRLLHNLNGTGFIEADEFLPSSEDIGNSEAAAWGDLNNDGFLDLYVANYEQGKVLRAQCGRDRLYLNRQGRGFVESSQEVGAVSEEPMCGRGVVWSDLNGDGRQDILVTNYRLDPNFLWLNRGDGSVTDAAESTGVQGDEAYGAYGHSIGVVSGDLDGDGDLDLYITNLAHPRYLEFSDRSMLLINNGDPLPVFANRFAGSGIPFEETGSDPVLFDVDNDGDLDLYVTSVYPNRSSHLYINDGKGKFSDRTWLAGAGVANGWGAAISDYDNDGYPDLLVASREGVRLLHNRGGENNWLSVALDDQSCNRQGVGDRIILTCNGQSLVREVTAGRGTGSQDSLKINFGLGKCRGPAVIRVNTLCGGSITREITTVNRQLIFDTSIGPANLEDLDDKFLN